MYAAYKVKIEWKVNKTCDFQFIMATNDSMAQCVHRALSFITISIISSKYELFLHKRTTYTNGFIFIDYISIDISAVSFPPNE